jgi:glutaredoxin
VPVLTLYGKPGCHLCDDARAVVREALAGRDVALREVDVTLDPALERRYGERIPVLSLDGEELFDYVVDPDALRERLRRSANDRPGRARRDR